jgi:lipopolysaccharide/colanic/teichoic acid biosynthesis glycosyltransferase
MPLVAARLTTLGIEPIIPLEVTLMPNANSLLTSPPPKSLDPHAVHAEMQRPRPRIRPATEPPVSLALESFYRGKPLVAPLGNRSRGYLAAKRLFDVCGSTVLLVLFSPVMLTTFVVLCITTQGRPLFFQERIGLCGRRFWMIKFRTMRLDADRLQHVVANEKDGPIFKNRRDPRITRVGRFLRGSSIDEMPQLFNVLLGSMSLVGPRPPVAKEVVQYAPWQRRRLAVQPGLTCLWQISGRSEIEFEKWVRMDLWYLRNQNFWTDLRLLARTPASVLSGRGAY